MHRGDSSPHEHSAANLSQSCLLALLSKIKGEQQGGRRKHDGEHNGQDHEKGAKWVTAANRMAAMPT